MQAAGVERRRGNMEATKEIFDRCLAICQEREDKNAHSHVSLKYARFHTLVSIFFISFILTPLLTVCICSCYDKQKLNTCLARMCIMCNSHMLFGFGCGSSLAIASQMWV